MPVTYTFGSATSAIPLSQLDSNFATPITIGNVVAKLGNVVSTIGNVTLANPTVSTNLNFSSGTNGIVFNNSGATTNSTLNDYETGTWTPSAAPGAGSITYTSAATYFKVGRLVYVSGYISISSVTGASGTLQISNLPFSSGISGTYQNQIGAARDSQTTGGFYGAYTGPSGSNLINIQTLTGGGPVYLANYTYSFSLSYYASF